jgi:hypothetical protein
MGPVVKQRGFVKMAKLEVEEQQQIVEFIKNNPSLNRTKLSQEICRLLSWVLEHPPGRPPLVINLLDGVMSSA